MVLDCVGRKAGFSIRAMNRMAALVGSHNVEYTQLRDHLQQYKEESAQVRLLFPLLFSKKNADHVFRTFTGSVGGEFYFDFFSSGTPLIRRFVQTASITHHHNLAHPSEEDKFKKSDEINVNSPGADDLHSKMAKASLDEKDRKIERGRDVGP